MQQLCPCLSFYTLIHISRLRFAPSLLRIFELCSIVKNFKCECNNKVIQLNQYKRECGTLFKMIDFLSKIYIYNVYHFILAFCSIRYSLRFGVPQMTNICYVLRVIFLSCWKCWEKLHVIAWRWIIRERQLVENF